MHHYVYILRLYPLLNVWLVPSPRVGWCSLLGTRTYMYVENKQPSNTPSSPLLSLLRPVPGTPEDPGLTEAARTCHHVFPHTSFIDSTSLTVYVTRYHPPPPDNTAAPNGWPMCQSPKQLYSQIEFVVFFFRERWWWGGSFLSFLPFAYRHVHVDIHRQRARSRLCGGAACKTPSLVLLLSEMLGFCFLCC